MTGKKLTENRGWYLSVPAGASSLLAANWTNGDRKALAGQGGADHGAALIRTTLGRRMAGDVRAIQLMFDENALRPIFNPKRHRLPLPLVRRSSL
jgi:hypothetical protein